jgi:hypothetical protein
VWLHKRFFRLIGALALLWMCAGILSSFLGSQGMAAPPGVEPNGYRMAEAVKAGSLYFCTGSAVLLLCVVVVSQSSWRTSLRGELRYILEDETIPSDQPHASTTTPGTGPTERRRHARANLRMSCSTDLSIVMSLTVRVEMIGS